MTIGQQEQPIHRQRVVATRRCLAVAEKLTVRGLQARLSSDGGMSLTTAKPVAR
jgi:hypothetical protein